MNMRESDCQRELSRSTKLPEEVYRIAFSYERGERAYKSYTGKPASTAPAISIKQEPVSNIRRGQGFFRGRGPLDVEDTPEDQVVVEEAEITVGVTIATHQILTWITSRAVLQKEQHVTRAENQWRGRGRVGLVREENEHHQSTQNVNELNEGPVSYCYRR